MRNLIIGDIHGCFGKLTDVLSRSGYDQDKDNLFFTGDMCDRGRENVKVVRFLMKLHNFFPVLGNHDVWLQNFLGSEEISPLWTSTNGGIVTVNDFQRLAVGGDERLRMAKWLQGIPFIRFTDSYVVVHGGIPSCSADFPLEIAKVKRNLYETTQYQVGDRILECDKLLWDRSYRGSAMYAKEHPEKLRDNSGEFDGIGSGGMSNPLWNFQGRTMFVGHTPLDEPFYSEAYRLVALDTGSFAKTGRITAVDMDTLDYWQSGVDDMRNLKRMERKQE